MIIRGAKSDMLASTTLQAMVSRRDEIEVVVVPDQGHPPFLTEPNLIRADYSLCRIVRPLRPAVTGNDLNGPRASECYCRERLTPYKDYRKATWRSGYATVCKFA
jgi:hypothetical protein